MSRHRTQTKNKISSQQRVESFKEWLTWFNRNKPRPRTPVVITRTELDDGSGKVYPIKQRYGEGYKD